MEGSEDKIMVTIQLLVVIGMYVAVLLEMFI